jgi:hypothetical protein
MVDFRAELVAIIDSFLAGERSFEAFHRDFSRCFIDEIPEEDLTLEMADQYGAVHEKTEWTTRSPTPEERDVGWIDVPQFSSWLRGYRETLREGARSS